MGSIGSKKPHAICVPYPSQGHVSPMMQLANLLHSRGFHVTFVNTQFNHDRLVRSGGLTGRPGFRFESIPDGLPRSDRDATQDVVSLCEATRRNCLGPFKELVGRVNSDGPPVSCVVSDGVMGFPSEVGRDLGLPRVRFWTASACSFLGYLHFDQLVKRGIVPFEDEKYLHDGTLDAPVDWIPGLRNTRLRDLPSFIRTKSTDDIMFDFMGSEARNCLDSSAIIFNTFDEFEHESLQAISSVFPSVYALGPLHLLGRPGPGSETSPEPLGSSLWKENPECLEWLDARDPNTVVYVNYGSVATMSRRHLKEFAWGLAKTGRPFVWILRPDIVQGSDPEASLPGEFLKEVKERAFLGNWCPQRRVLEHPAVRVFLTHCGWNSTLETVGAGVPVICWPFFGDQQTNCRYACVNWGTGLELGNDVARDDVARLVEEMVGGEKGRRLRENALEWKRRALEATRVGGSSYRDFDRLIKEVLN